MEGFVRRSGQIKGRALFKKQIPVTYEVNLDDGALVEEVTIRVLKPHSPEGTEASQAATLWIKGDTIFTASKKGDEVTRDTIKTMPGAMVYHPSLPILPLLEQMILRAKALGGKEVDLPVFLLSSNGETTTAKLLFAAQDSVRIKMGNIGVKLKITTDGELYREKPIRDKISKK